MKCISACRYTSGMARGNFTTTRPRRDPVEGKRKMVRGAQDGVPAGSKRCTRCMDVKAVEQFSKNVSKKDGLFAYCKPCQRDYMIQRLYGISRVEFERLNEIQGGRCAICEREPVAEGRNGKHLRVDHDHETGAVRGLLCTRCNVALGTFGDTVEGLKKAIRYLEGAPRTSSR